ncbi:MAG: TatD family hydrolase [bacterium]|nr:TatD family hydrolase [bacterium]
MYTDTHLHLDRREFAGEIDAVLARAQAAGVTRLINIGYDLPSSEASVALAAGDDRLRAAVGVHPHDALAIADAAGEVTPAGERALARLAELAADPRVVAIGEIGLDFYRDLSPRPAQRAALRAQLALAARLDLPVVLHVRDAQDDIVAELEAAGVPARGGILHSFAGGAGHAAWGVAHGFLLGIGGPVTYRNSGLPEVLAGVAPEHLVLETDAPWLPPVPHRGGRNEPAYLPLTAARVAEICGIAAPELARVTGANVDRLCGARGWA